MFALEIIWVGVCQKVGCGVRIRVDHNAIRLGNELAKYEKVM